VWAGAAAAGTGGVLLLLGRTKKDPAPTIDFSGTRVLWRIHF
jgi:hypothetical protein